jgi:hypothetical protein
MKLQKFLAGGVLAVFALPFLATASSKNASFEPMTALEAKLVQAADGYWYQDRVSRDYYVWVYAGSTCPTGKTCTWGPDPSTVCSPRGGCDPFPGHR